MTLVAFLNKYLRGPNRLGKLPGGAGLGAMYGRVEHVKRVPQHGDYD